jgi:hypothetical protein
MQFNQTDLKSYQGKEWGYFWEKRAVHEAEGFTV